MNVDIQSIRKPKPSYEGRNGFIEGPTEPEQINSSNLYDALNHHRRALYVINHKKSPIPTLEEMKTEIDKPDDDLGHIKERIKALQEDHLKDLERLYSFHAQDYKEEVMDRYLSQEEGQGGESDGRNLTPAEIRFQQIYNDGLKDQAIEIEWQDDYEAIRYTYISQLLALVKQRNEVETRQEEIRKRREQMFPISFDDFKGKAKDIQLRAARFLVADSAKQEKMISEFNWAWRQVQPLKDIFAKDVNISFAFHNLISYLNVLL
ncbi:hypothetical protein BYT27DRAFT_7121448 [Phlegmacium glaucopus]|nr:hypothetical protein BYT27DRAFT_7121448 [Phlegmacium glaucopus]